MLVLLLSKAISKMNTDYFVEQQQPPRKLRVSNFCVRNHEITPLAHLELHTVPWIYKHENALSFLPLHKECRFLVALCSSSVASFRPFSPPNTDYELMDRLRWVCGASTAPPARAPRGHFSGVRVCVPSLLCALRTRCCCTDPREQQATTVALKKII